MRQLAVISGKGGTGKTTVAAGLASLAGTLVIADCDVDAPNLALLMQSEVRESHDYSGSQIAVIDDVKCEQCGVCTQVCRFDAIVSHAVDPLACEGCGVCVHVCPHGAVAMEDDRTGVWYVSHTLYGPMVHARLEPGRGNSGKLVNQVRERARSLATDRYDLVLIDGPPGTGCPVISTLTGVTGALVVTEPTVSGIHDLRRVIEVCQHFNVPACVCVNKSDLSESNTHHIRAWSEANRIAVMSSIPQDRDVIDAAVHGAPIVEWSSGPASVAVKRLWEQLGVWLDLQPGN